jgi:hypothetical protein
MTARVRRGSRRSRRRRSRRREPGARSALARSDIGEGARLRAREPLVGERIQHSETIWIATGPSFSEEWVLSVTSGKMPPYGVLDAGRIVIDVGRSLDGDPLAALLWVKERGRKKITHVWVDETVQRRGVGRLLVDAYKKYVSAKVVMAGPFSEAGRAFAKRLGAAVAR